VPKHSLKNVRCPHSAVTGARHIANIGPKREGLFVDHVKSADTTPFVRDRGSPIAVTLDRKKKSRLSMNAEWPRMNAEWPGLTPLSLS